MALRENVWARFLQHCVDATLDFPQAGVGLPDPLDHRLDVTRVELRLP